MTFYDRRLDLPEMLKRKSHFLFGPRATGKSSLIQMQFSANIPVIDLLDTRTYQALSQKPYEIHEILAAASDSQFIIIDEVQKVPALLNEVHRLIEKENKHFLLTGSSARRLRASGVNLLAGRAWEVQLFPLTYAEVPNFDLNRFLQYGGLPAVYNSNYPQEELKAYVKTYLSEEIQAEAFVRKIPAFSRFMEIAALTSGQILNFSSLASDTGVNVVTIREYYQILEDTFIGFMVPAWQKSVKRKPTATAKFYCFDIGVRNTLAGIDPISPASDLYGQAFEHFIAMELRALISYKRLNMTLSYWSTKHGQEVDFILGDDIAIEVKATHKVSDKHLKTLKYLQEEGICKHFYLVSQDPLERIKDNVHILHWRDFLSMIEEQLKYKHY